MNWLKIKVKLQNIYFQINTLNPSLGRSAKERDQSVGDIISELTIMREQLRHPNIVRYYKTFVERKLLKQ